MSQDNGPNPAALIRAHIDADGYLSVKVTPGAPNNTVAAGVDAQGRAILFVRIRGKAVDGAANAALIGYLSQLLQCAKGQIVIERGTTARLKRLRIRL